MDSAIDKQQVLDQMNKLESNLVSMKDQLEKDKEKLDDPNLIDKLNKSRNFFTDPIMLFSLYSTHLKIVLRSFSFFKNYH